MPIAETEENAPPPPPTAPITLVAVGLAPPAPPPMTLMVLPASVQSAGTVHVVPLVRIIVAIRSPHPDPMALAYAMRMMALLASAAGNTMVKLPAVAVLSDPNASTHTALLEAVVL